MHRGRNLPDAGRGRAVLPEQAGTVHRALDRRQRNRSHGAGAVAEADRGAGPAGGAGQSRRRRGDYRHRGRRPVGTRRLHHLCRGLGVDGHQPRAVPEGWLRSGQGFRAGVAGFEILQCAVRASFGAGEIGEGTDRAGEGPAGRIADGFGGQRFDQSPGGRALQETCQGQHRACALQERRTTGHRPAERRDASGILAGIDVDHACQSRQTAHARRLQSKAA